MPLQQHHIEDLKRIYRKRFGRDLADRDAWAMAHRLVTLFRVLSEESKPTVSPETLTSRTNCEFHVQDGNLCQKIN